MNAVNLTLLTSAHLQVTKAEPSSYKAEKYWKVLPSKTVFCWCIYTIYRIEKIGVEWRKRNKNEPAGNHTKGVGNSSWRPAPVTVFKLLMTWWEPESSHCWNFTYLQNLLRARRGCFLWPNIIRAFNFYLRRVQELALIQGLVPCILIMTTIVSLG